MASDHPVSILTMTHRGAACGVASVHSSPTIKKTDLTCKVLHDFVMPGFATSLQIWH